MGARTRDIKPGFFENEDVGSLTFAGRLLYIGLWTLADREGLLEDRPMRIAKQLFPFDRRLNIEALLGDLEDKRFIVRYEVDDKRVIWMPTFRKNQRIHPNEARSRLPAPPANLQEEFRVSFNGMSLHVQPLDRNVASYSVPSGSSEPTSNLDLETPLTPLAAGAAKGGTRVGRRRKRDELKDPNSVRARVTSRFDALANGGQA